MKKTILSLLSIAVLAICWSAEACGQVGVYSSALEGKARKSTKRSWGGLQFLGPDTIADVAESIGSSVVNINVKMSEGRRGRRGRRSKSSKQSPRGYEGWGPGRGTGSGVIVSPDGMILTSNHVIDGADQINITLKDGRIFAGEVIGHDRFSDLALLKIDARNLSKIKFGRTRDVRPGDWVIAMGSPLGLDNTVTLGIVSALGREAKGLHSFGARSGAVRFIQTDAAINPGNSGGPLVNLKGEVVGINTFIHGSAQNIGFAIPADIARDVSEKLSRFQEMTHPFIGIVMADLVDDDLSVRGITNRDKAVLVQSVMPRSPAFLAGVQPGDLIVEVDGKPVDDSTEVSEAVRKHRIGDYVNIKVMRVGSEKSIKVPVEQLPEKAR